MRRSTKLVGKYIVLTLFLASLSFFNNGCSKTNYEGEWEGKTSDGQTFIFSVKENRVGMIYIGFVWSGNCGGQTSAAKAFIKKIKISNNAFSMEDEATPDFNKKGTKISGKFDSENNASGTFEANDEVENGRNYSRCNAHTQGTWTATKKMKTNNATE